MCAQSDRGNQNKCTTNMHTWNLKYDQGESKKNGPTALLRDECTLCTLLVLRFFFFPVGAHIGTATGAPGGVPHHTIGQTTAGSNVPLTTVDYALGCAQASYKFTYKYADCH